MTGVVAYIDNARSVNKNGFIRGVDGKMYWFSKKCKKLKCGDTVQFKGDLDEKGFIATTVSFGGA